MNRFFGLLLMAIGGMMAILSGLRAISSVGSALVQSLTTMLRQGFPYFLFEFLMRVALTFVFGGMPMLIGLGLFRGGLKLASKGYGSGGNRAGSGETSQDYLMSQDRWAWVLHRAPGALVVVSGVVMITRFALFIIGVSSFDALAGTRFAPAASLTSRIVGGWIVGLGIVMVLAGVRLVRVPRSDREVIASPTEGQGQTAKFLGYIVISIGALVTGLSGLCTLFVTLPMLWAKNPEGNVFGTVFSVMGFVAFLLGLGFLFLGRSLLPRSPPPGTEPH